VTTYLCRGKFQSSWAASGSYDFVAEALFGELNVDGFFLEYDDERSGGFEPLRFVPPGKMVVLGLVTTKVGALEKPDDLNRRIDEGRGTCRWSSCACPASAGSPPPSRATRSATTRKSPSSSSSSRSPRTSGDERGYTGGLPDSTLGSGRNLASNLRGRAATDPSPITKALEGWRVYGRSSETRERRATMVTIGVVAGVIVAIGTITAGAIRAVSWIFSRGRKAEEERAERAKVAADLEDLKKRLLG
jgi:hypothetical protein